MAGKRNGGIACVCLLVLLLQCACAPQQGPQVLQIPAPTETQMGETKKEEPNIIYVTGTDIPQPILLYNGEAAIWLEGIGFAEDYSSKLKISVRVENTGRAKEDVKLSISGAYINDCRIGASLDLYAAITPGETVQETISFPLDTDALIRQGIYSIREIDMYFTLYQGETYVEVPVFLKTQLPTPLEMPTAKVQSSAYQIMGIVCYEENNITIELRSFERGISGYEAYLYLENRTSLTFHFTIDQVFGDNDMLPVISHTTSVHAGKKVWSVVEFPYKMFFERGIAMPCEAGFHVTVWAEDGEEIADVPIRFELEAQAQVQELVQREGIRIDAIRREVEIGKTNGTAIIYLEIKNDTPYSIRLQVSNAKIGGNATSRCTLSRKTVFAGKSCEIALLVETDMSALQTIERVNWRMRIIDEETRQVLLDTPIVYYWGNSGGT